MSSEDFEVNTPGRAQAIGYNADTKASNRLAEETKPSSKKEREIIKQATTKPRRRGKDN